MTTKPSIKQLDAVTRVLSNTQKFLVNGLFPGGNAQALLEAQGYITSLLEQTKKQLQFELDERLIDKEETEANVEEPKDAVSKG